jgi:hypothetical protein
LRLDGPETAVARAGRRGRRPPVGAGTFEFADETGKRESDEPGAVTVNVRDLGILHSKEKMSRERRIAERKRKRNPEDNEPSRPIEIDLHLLWLRVKDLCGKPRGTRVYSVKGAQKEARKKNGNKSRRTGRAT